MSYKAILFDADGVVIRSTKWFTDLLQESHDSPPDKLKEFFKGPFKDCKVGKADLKKEFAKVVDDWKWDGTVDELLEYWLSSDCDPDPAIVHVIHELRENGVKCYMATNQEHYRTEFFKEKFSDLFDGIFASADIGHQKHEVEFYEYVMSHLDKDKSEVLLIDDQQKNVDIAEEFGIDSIFYKKIQDIEHLLKTTR